MVKTTEATPPFLAVQQQVCDWLVENKRYIKASAIEKECEMPAYSIGRGLDKFKQAGCDINAMERLPFTGAYIAKILPILARLGFELKKDGKTIPLGRGKTLEVGGIAITYSELLKHMA